MTKDGKIKILVIPSDHFGCGFWRSKNPHSALALKMPEQFSVDISYDIPTTGMLEDFYKQYDIVHIHKKLDDEAEIIRFLKHCGCMVIVDIDDAQKLDKEHPMFLSSVNDKWYIPINKNLAAANAVTTTTKIFADEIKKELNKNVFVFPNALPEGEGQFVLHKQRETNRIRFGIVCGSSHYHDLLILQDMVEKMPEDYLKKIQFVLCGFDVHGTKTIYKAPEDEGGEPIVERIAIKPEESVWNEFERILTNNYRTISEEHKKWLLEYHADTLDPFIDEPYRRFWTIPIDNYYQQYNHIDVLMAPLFENHFDKVKSNLKFVEAAFAHIPVIATNFGPYSYDREPVIKKGGYIDKNGDCFVVDTIKNKKDWLRTVKWIVDNPDSIQWAGENLYQHYRNKYSLNAVTDERAKVYSEILSNKKKYYKDPKWQQK